MLFSFHWKYDQKISYQFVGLQAEFRQGEDGTSPVKFQNTKGKMKRLS